MALTNRLLATLEEWEMSQTELAALAGIPYPRVRRIVRPDSNPFLDDVLRIARVLNLTVAELFSLARDGADTR